MPAERPETRFTRLHYGANTTLDIEAPGNNMGVLINFAQTVTIDLKRKSDGNWTEPRIASQFPDVNKYVKRNANKLFPKNKEPIKRRLLDPMLQGKSEDELREIFECGRDAIRRERMGILATVEGAFMEPLDLHPLSFFKNGENSTDPKRLVNALRGGRLDGVLFMDRWYTTQQAIDIYLNPPTIPPTPHNTPMWAVPWRKRPSKVLYDGEKINLNQVHAETS